MRDKRRDLSSLYSIVYVILCGIFIWIIYGLTIKIAKYDSTDDIQNHNRSGLLLYTDHLTGCQYLKGGTLGGITPRLDRSGKQICK